MNDTYKKIDVMSVTDGYNGFCRGVRCELSALLSDGGAMLLLLFATLIYVTIYSVAYGREVVRDVTIAIVDEDDTPSSRSFVAELSSGPRTWVGYGVPSLAEAEELFYRGEVFGVVYLAKGYERALLAGRSADVAVMLDGSHLLLYRNVLEQVTADALTAGATVEAARLVAREVDEAQIRATLQPVTLNVGYLYNPAMGYGSFVMPTIVVVIVQQTLVIGLALLAARRREMSSAKGVRSLHDAVVSVAAKIVVYIVIYAAILTFILVVLWPLFGFPYRATLWRVVIFLGLYLLSAAAMALTLSHLFRRREAPFMLLLWSSVPILLLAGISYPREALPAWLYELGRLLPSSSGVNGFVRVASMGATLSDVAREIVTLAVLAFAYLGIAIFAEWTTRSAPTNASPARR